MNKQELEKSLLSEVNSQPYTANAVTSTNIPVSAERAFEAANRLLSEVKNATNATSAVDLTQQTLIDVNSQPLISGLLAAHSVYGQQQQPQHQTNDSSTISEQLSSALLHQSHPLNELNSSNSNNMGTTTVVANSSSTANYDNISDNMDVPLTESADIITDPTHPLMSEFQTRFGVGRVFESLEALRGAVFEYGKKYNVALTTSKSDKSKVYLLCKHGGKHRKVTKKSDITAAAAPTTPALATPKKVKTRVRLSQKTGCECMIYARKCRDGLWMIKKSIPQHNHPIASDPAMYPMYRSLPPEYLLVVHKLLQEHVSTGHIVKSLRANGISNIVTKDIDNIQQDMKKKGLLDNPPNSVNVSALLDSFPVLSPTTIAPSVTTATTPAAESAPQGDFIGGNANNDNNITVVEPVDDNHNDNVLIKLEE
ncbi:hypothetical protein BDF20DRAFT_881551 [Mycotypha africana]|uniref:uncharacterized protein n=1 Tax=Mycotypha africana TaxID=64632 RepID=UPI002301E21B|nr:uncharacterized protein BDF20DRAFT_881551 [Mycotypha africana]KAI8973287.1 hypothetical protein BDF20DRAFT_881551 [Mycotypha africana]